MQKQAIVALGAGLASALLFVVPAKGTVLAILVAHFTALPIMIAALGFGHVSGLAGGILGIGAVALTLGPVPGVIFALFFALPGWWLAYLTLLARPAPGTPAALVWYPVGRIATWAAGLAIGAVLVLGGVVLVRYGGYAAAIAALARRLEQAVGPGQGTHDTARIVVRFMPLATAASLFLILTVNLWLAGRVARLSDRLRRPWPDVPDGFRLPVGAAVVFLLSLGSFALGGLAATAGGTVAAALGLAFALQGLAAAHVLTRGFRSRRAILALIYIITFVVPVAAAALCVIGLVDCLFSLRARRPPSNPMPPPKGV